MMNTKKIIQKILKVMKFQSTKISKKKYLLISFYQMILQLKLLIM